MNNIYGVTLKTEGKIYYFNGVDLDIDKDSYVVVETEKGVQIGKLMYRADNDKVNIPIEEMKDEELKSATVWKIKVGAEGYEEEIFSLLIDWYQDEIFISSELKKKN